MQNTLFGAELLTLPNIFRDKLFTIPDYQRGYAWDDKQVQELLRDIEHLLDDGVNQRHYTGTLVLSRPIHPDDVDFRVVDGQQRLTTLVILMRMIAEHLNSIERSDFERLYLLRGEIGSDRSVLRLNADTRAFFESVILGNASTAHEPPVLEPHVRLLNARKLIETWLKERIKDGKTIAQIRESVETEIGFIVFAPKEDAETGIMFEVINNRGKSLSELEKVKNYLIYCSVKLGANTLRTTIDGDWSEILRNLNTAGKTSQTDEGAFLRYCMAVHFQLNKTDSQNGYDELKKRLSLEHAIKTKEGKEDAITAIKQFVCFLKIASLWYARLYGKQHNGLEKSLIEVLDQLRGQDRQASIMPLLMALMIKNKGQGSRLIELLKLLETLNFRVYMARNITARNDTGQGELYELAGLYYRGILLDEFDENSRKIGRNRLESDEDALEYRLVSFVLRYSPETRFTESFKLEPGSVDDFFDWRGLRYFLMSYEQHLQPNKTVLIDKITRSRNEGKSADYLSVEHLWATENRNQPGENDRVVDKFEKRRLGNFVLLELRLNIQGYNDNLDIKCDRYLESDKDEPATDLAQVRKAVRTGKKIMKSLEGTTKSKNYYLRLHRAINDEQEDRYVNFARRRWSVDGHFGYKTLIKELGEETE